MRSSAPATLHEHVLIDSMTIVPGSSDDLACDLRGFTRSAFNRLRVYNFDLGVWFGGDIATYHSSWINVFSQFYLSENLVGFNLSGVDGTGGGTANQIMLTEGSLVCRDAAGGIAVDAVNGQVIVETTDIGYGDQSDGIVLRSGAIACKVINSRFEWDNQNSARYPIRIESGSYYHYFAGNSYSSGFSLPNLLDSNGATARYIQIDDFARNADFPDGYVDFNCDVLFSRNPTFASGLYIPIDANAALAVADGNDATAFNINTNASRVQIPNSNVLEWFSDDFNTRTAIVEGATGNAEFAELTADSADINSSAAQALLVRTGATDKVNVNNTSNRLELVNGMDLRMYTDGYSTTAVDIDGATGNLSFSGTFDHNGTTFGAFSATPVTKPTVTGSRGGNAALASLLTALANLGLITNSTTA